MKEELENLIWAVETFGGGQSLRHPRITRALSRAKKVLYPESLWDEKMEGFRGEPPEFEQVFKAEFTGE